LRSLKSERLAIRVLSYRQLGSIAGTSSSAARVMAVSWMAGPLLICFGEMGGLMLN